MRLPKRKTVEMLGKLYRPLLKRLDAASSSGTPIAVSYQNWTANPEVVIRWELYQSIKALYEAGFGRIFRHRLLDPHEISNRLSALFDALAVMAIPRVVVLSPLPCPDKLTMSYRRDVEPLFRSAAADHGFSYLDVLRLGSEWASQGNALKHYADVFHLNALGHRNIGLLLGKHLEMMENIQNPDGATVQKSRD